MSFVKVAKLFGQAKRKESIPHLEQVALAFQKYLKEEQHVMEMKETEGCVEALRSLVSEPPSDTAWRRCLAALCNISAMESQNVSQWLWRSGLVVLAVSGVLKSHGPSDETEDLQSPKIVTCVTNMLSNLVIDAENRVNMVAHIDSIVPRVMTCLQHYFAMVVERASQNGLGDDGSAVIVTVVVDLFTVIGQLVLEPTARSALEEDNNVLNLMCDALDIGPLMKSASACMWNVTNNSTIMRRKLMDRGILEKLVSMSKSTTLHKEAIDNIKYVIQILSMETSASNALSMDDILWQLNLENGLPSVASAAGTLWNLARSADRREDALEKGAVQRLTSLLEDHKKMDKEAKYKITGALSTLCMVDNGAKQFQAGGGTQSLLEMIQEMQTKDPFSETEVAHNTLEICLALLNNATTVTENRSYVRRSRGSSVVATCLVNSMRYPERLFNVLKTATSVCINLSIDDGDGDEVLNMMRSEGIINALVDLLKYQDKDLSHEKLKKIQKKASSALWNLAVHKPNLDYMEKIGAIASLVQHMPEFALTKNADCPTLAMSGYFTQPSLRRLEQMTTAELAHVENFCVGHRRYGFVIWPGMTNVCGLDLDGIVTIGKRFVEVDSQQAPVLNKPALVTLTRISPKRGESVDSLVARLKKASSFVSYDKTKKEWCFRVEHFSRIGLDSVDDDDDDYDDTLSSTESEFTELDLDDDEEDDDDEDDSLSGNAESEAIDSQALLKHVDEMVGEKPSGEGDGGMKHRKQNNIALALATIRRMGRRRSSSTVSDRKRVKAAEEKDGIQNHLRQFTSILNRMGKRLIPTRTQTADKADVSSFAKSSDAIDTIMDTCYDAFLKFSQSEYSSENVLLYSDILQYWRIINKRRIHHDKKFSLVKSVGSTFLRDGSQMEVNVPQQHRYRVMEDIFNNHLTSLLFDPLLPALKGNLVDIHDRFITSPLYKTYLKTLDVKRNVLQRYVKIFFGRNL